MQKEAAEGTRDKAKRETTCNEGGGCTFLEELDGELAKGVDGKDGNVVVGHAAHLVEVVAHDSPNVRPFVADALHVVVCNVDELRQAVHARRRLQQLLTVSIGDKRWEWVVVMAGRGTGEKTGREGNSTQ